MNTYFQNPSIRIMGFLLVSLVFLSNPVWSQKDPSPKMSVTQGKPDETAYYLPEVVVTGYKPSEKHSKPYVEDTVSAGELEDSQPGKISDALDKLPSVANVGSGYFASPSIRGMSRRRTLVLVNGERLDTMRNLGVSASHISPLGVREVSVLRGPFSTIYGSDAMGGIINIITKSPELSQKKMYDVSFNSAYFGNGNGVTTGLAAAIGTDTLNYSFVGSFRDQGNTQNPGGEVAYSGYTDYNLTNSVFWKFTPSQSVKVSASYARGLDVGNPTGESTKTGTHPEELNQSLTVKYLNQIDGVLLKDFQVRLSLKQMHDTIQVTNQNIAKNAKAKVFNETFIGPMLDYQIYQELQLGSFAGLLLGFSGYYQSDVSIKGHKKVYELSSGAFKKDFGVVDFVSDGEALDAGIFAEMNAKISERLNIGAGLRYDYFLIEAAWQTEEAPDIGLLSQKYPKEKTQLDALSYHVGGSWRFWENTSTFFNAGTAFRAPSIKDLYYSGNTPYGYTKSNPDLMPEESVNLETGVKYVKQKISASASVFYTFVQNLIAIRWDDAQEIGTFENIGKAEIKGVEGSLATPLGSGFSLDLGSALMQGRDIHFNEPLEDVPPWEVFSGLSFVHKLDDLDFRHRVEVNYSHAENAVVSGDTPAAAFVTVDYFWALVWKANYKLTLSVTNIFDAKYRPFHHHE